MYQGLVCISVLDHLQPIQQTICSECQTAIVILGLWDGWMDGCNGSGDLAATVAACSMQHASVIKTYRWNQPERRSRLMILAKHDISISKNSLALHREMCLHCGFYSRAFLKGQTCGRKTARTTVRASAQQPSLHRWWTSLFVCAITRRQILFHYFQPVIKSRSA